MEALSLNKFWRRPRYLEVFELLKLRQRLLRAKLTVCVVVILVVVNAVSCGHQVSLGVIEVRLGDGLGANGHLLRGKGIDGLVCLHRID